MSEQATRPRSSFAGQPTYVVGRSEIWPQGTLNDIDQVAMRSKDGEILSGWTFDRHDASCIRDLVKFAEENKNLIATMKSKVPQTSRGERYESDDEDLDPRFFPDWSQNANITGEPCPFLEKGYHEHN